jgi:hypothetical protein
MASTFFYTGIESLSETDRDPMLFYERCSRRVLTADSTRRKIEVRVLAKNAVGEHFNLLLSEKVLCEVLVLTTLPYLLPDA